MTNILLTTPVQCARENPAVELNAKDLKIWISHLPTSDVASTVDALDKAISAFNELHINNRERFALLEIYHEAYDAILQNYDEMRLKQLKMPPRDRSNLAKQIMWLYVKLGHGYKIIVKNCYETGINPKKESFLSTSIFRSLELSSHSLMFAKRCGTALPPRIFQEVNQLFAFAEHFDAHEIPIRAAKGYAKTPTISSFHSLILLMNIIELDRLESLQIQTLFYALQPFTHLCSYSKTTNQSVQFVYELNLIEDRAPKSCTNNTANQQECTRFFCVDALVKELQNWIEKNQGEDNFMIETELELFPELLCTLEQNRSMAQSANGADLSSIIREGQSVYLATGLVSIQSLLISELAHLSVGLNNKLSEWTVNKVTAHGCELTKNVELCDDHVSLGECVGVVTKTDSESRFSVKTVALIHKAELQAGQHISMRIEYLSEHATPIGYSLDTNASSDDDLISGISMPQGSTMCNQPYLIIDKKHYSDDCQLSIKLPDKIMHVQPKKLIMNTMHYAIFLYTDVTDTTSDLQIRNTA